MYDLCRTCQGIPGTSGSKIGKEVFFPRSIGKKSPVAILISELIFLVYHPY